MTTLMPLLSVTGLVLLLLTAVPTSCNGLTPGSHLAPFSLGDVKDEDTSAPGVVIDNSVDVKAEGFVEKDKIADELTESALKDDVLQTLETTGLNADSHDGLPPLQSVERGSKVTSSRAARLRRNRGVLEAQGGQLTIRSRRLVDNSFPVTGRKKPPTPPLNASCQGQRAY
ncbi:hypothetical protein C0Q70_18625 [Pomacea canaliculata]|uniref:Uncharacterized protein n=1 Tax=Pomacea canaliculata TaxID=400727 RepID=A0A2T7NH19_POMCA|nr:hypothetical protein C0Q70_18625 [Pomacea canaliculata]